MDLGCVLLEVASVLILVCSCSGSGSDFELEPVNSTYFKGFYFPCYCQGSRNALSFEWTINGEVVTKQTPDIIIHSEHSFAVAELFCNQDMFTVKCCYQVDLNDFVCSDRVQLVAEGPPTSVTNLQASPTTENIILTWDAIDPIHISSVEIPSNFPPTFPRMREYPIINGSVGYNVTVNGVESYTVYNPTFTYTPTNPGPSESYEFMVIAFNAAGEGGLCTPVNATLKDSSTAIPDTDVFNSTESQSKSYVTVIAIVVSVISVITIIVSIMIIVKVQCHVVRGQSQSKHDCVENNDASLESSTVLPSSPSLSGVYKQSLLEEVAETSEVHEPSLLKVVPETSEVAEMHIVGGLATNPGNIAPDTAERATERARVIRVKPISGSDDSELKDLGGSGGSEKGREFNNENCKMPQSKKPEGQEGPEQTEEQRKSETEEGERRDSGIVIDCDAQIHISPSLQRFEDEFSEIKKSSNRKEEKVEPEVSTSTDQDDAPSTRVIVTHTIKNVIIRELSDPEQCTVVNDVCYRLEIVKTLKLPLHLRDSKVHRRGDCTDECGVSDEFNRMMEDHANHAPQEEELMVVDKHKIEKKHVKQPRNRCYLD